MKPSVWPSTFLCSLLTLTGADANESHLFRWGQATKEIRQLKKEEQQLTVAAIAKLSEEHERLLQGTDVPEA